MFIDEYETKNYKPFFQAYCWLLAVSFGLLAVSFWLLAPHTGSEMIFPVADGRLYPVAPMGVLKLLPGTPGRSVNYLTRLSLLCVCDDFKRCCQAAACIERLAIGC
ncbi:hypothetical protein [Dyadobacter sp. 32]|uniref:hypothetical protein n=1 Tax=Dyadobacter sp. 32 TaxID=538966 RepID=UPI0011EFD193